MNELATTQKKLEAAHRANKTLDAVGRALGSLKAMRQRLQEGDLAAVQKELKPRLVNACKVFEYETGEAQKELYNAQAKHGKAIAKRFKLDIEAAPVMPPMDKLRPMTDRAVVMHLLRQGDFDNAKAVSDEIGLPRDEGLWLAFELLHTIMTSLDAGQVDAAIEWARMNHLDLQQRHSSLEFDLHKTRYIHIFKTQHVFEAIKYAQAEFPIFAKTHRNEIQQLFTALAYHDKIEDSPYATLFSTPQAALKEVFARDYLALLHLGVKPPLQTTVEAATFALPKLIKLASLKVSKPAEEDGTKTTPAGFEVDLPAQFRHHSVFVCPVTRDVSASGFLLACGHVIGVEALQGLARGTSKLKCVYCPTLSNVSEARPLSF